MDRQKNALLMPVEAEVSRLQNQLRFPHGVINPQSGASREWTVGRPSPSSLSFTPHPLEHSPHRLQKNRSPAWGQPVSVCVRECVSASAWRTEGTALNRAHFSAKFAVQVNVDCFSGTKCFWITTHPGYIARARDRARESEKYKTDWGRRSKYEGNI